MHEAPADNRRFEFRWDARRLKWLALFIAVIGAGGVAMLFVDGWDVKLLGGLWAAAFAYGTFELLRRRSIHTPVVIVSEDGILDARILDRPISWDAVSRVEAFEAEHVPFIGLHFKDVVTALPGAKRSVKLLARVQPWLGFPPVSIKMTPLNGSNEDLVQAIATFRPDLVTPE